MGSLKKNSRKGKKSKKYKKYRRQKGGDAYSLDRNIKEINECIWRKKMEKEQRDEDAYRQELLKDPTSEHRREVKEYLYFLPKKDESEPVDDSDAVIKTFDTMGRIINNKALDEYLIYFDITPKDFEELKRNIISEITSKSGKIPEGYENFIRNIESLTFEKGLGMIEEKFGKKKKPKTPPTLLYLNPLENIEKIKYVEQLKLFFTDYNESQYQKFKARFELCSDKTSDPDSMNCQIRDGGLPKMVSEDSDLEALLHSMYVSAHEVEESYQLYANGTEKKYNFHKIIKEMVVFIIENVYNFEELKAYAKFFIDEKEMFKLFFKCRIESSKYNILHVSYAYLTKQTHKKLAEIEGNESLKEFFLKEVNQKNFEKLPEKVLEYWDTQCSSGTKTRSKTKRALNELKSIHDSMLGCSILNKKKPTLGGGRKKTKKKNKLKGGADTISNNAIQEILVDIAKNAFQEDKEDFLHDSSHDNLITRSYGKEDENTLEAKCSDGVTVSEKIKSFGKFFLINDKGLPDETVFPNPCGDSFNNTLSFVIDAGSFKQFRPYHKNKCENDPNFTTTKNVSNYVDPAATGKGDLYRCYTVLSQSGNNKEEQAIDGANRFVKLCVAFTRALIIDGEQKLDHHDLKPSPNDYKYIFEYLEGIRIIDIYKSDLVCLYKNNKERFVWEGNQSPMASFINSAYDESNIKKIADPRSKNNTSLFLKTFFEKVDNDDKADKKKEIKIGMCRILKYMGDKSHIIACIILILITEKKKKKPYIVQTIDRLLSKAIIQVIEYCKSNKDNNYESISKNLGVMISGGELNKPPKYAQGLPAYSNIFNNNNLDFVTNPYNILFLYFTGDPITAKEGIITEICKNLAEFSQVFKNDLQREPIRTIYYVTSMCYRVAGNTYEGADKESLIKGQLEEDLVTNEDNSPTDPINISDITAQRDDETQLIQRDDETQLIEFGDKLVTAASAASEDEDKEDKLDEFIEALTNEDLFKFMSLYKKVESVKKNKDDFDRLYKKYVENRPGGLNYLLKVKTTMRAPRVSTVKYRVEQEGGNVHIWNDKKKEGLFPPFTVVNPEIRFSEYYKLLSLSFEEPKYGEDYQRLEIKTHCQQLVDYITALEDSLKNGEDYPYDDTLYGVIKLSLGYEDSTPESDGGSLANHRYAITKRFEEGTLTGFVNRAQGFITSITKIVELSRNIVNINVDDPDDG